MNKSLAEFTVRERLLAIYLDRTRLDAGIVQVFLHLSTRSGQVGAIADADFPEIFRNHSNLRLFTQKVQS